MSVRKGWLKLRKYVVDETLTLSPGLFVEVKYEDDLSVACIKDLWEDGGSSESSGEKTAVLDLRWFYRYRETLGTIVKRIKGGGDASQRVKVPLPTGVDLIPTGEAERIFLSDNEGDALTINEPLECVVRIVKVAYVMPGGSPPPAAIADYWFDQTYKDEFRTARDCHQLPDNLPRPFLITEDPNEAGSWLTGSRLGSIVDLTVDSSDEEGALGEASDNGKWAAASRSLPESVVGHPSSNVDQAACGRSYDPPAPSVGVMDATQRRGLRELGLCCGSGGFAGLATDGVGRYAEIRPQWAVDICRTAATTYKINNPQAHVWNLGLDEMLWLLRLWDELFEELREKVVAEEDAEEDAEESESERRNLETIRNKRDGLRESRRMRLLQSNGLPRASAAWCPPTSAVGTGGPSEPEADAEVGVLLSAQTRKESSVEPRRGGPEPQGPPAQPPILTIVIDDSDDEVADAPLLPVDLDEIPDLEEMTAASVTQLLKASTPVRPSPPFRVGSEARGRLDLIKQEEEEWGGPLGARRRERRSCTTKTAISKAPSKRRRKGGGQRSQAGAKRVKAEDVGGRRGLTPLPFDVNETFGDAYHPDDVFEIERIHAVRVKVVAPDDAYNAKGLLVRGLSREEVSLEFLVEYRDSEGCDWRDDKWLWEPRSIVNVVDKELIRFVRRWDRLCVIPRPCHGRDMIISGGPPCQGMSGFNRNKRDKDIFGCPKNRIIEPYLKIVDFLKPAYIATEQVPDILTTDGGVYLRHILASLQRPALRYQTSIYVLPAGAYGVPQWRYRVIVLAARQGEVLPPMPAPMFRVGQCNTNTKTDAQQCYIWNTNIAQGYGLWPELVTGSALSDLKPCDNFTVSSTSGYGRDACNALQLYLRRQPPEGEPSELERVLEAELAIGADMRSLSRSVLALVDAGGDEGLVAIGRALNSSRLDLRAKLEELERNGCFSDQETEAGGLKKSNLTVTSGLQVVDWRKQVSYGNVAMARDRTMRDPSPVLYTSADSEAGGDEEDEDKAELLVRALRREEEGGGGGGESDAGETEDGGGESKAKRGWFQHWPLLKASLLKLPPDGPLGRGAALRRLADEQHEWHLWLGRKVHEGAKAALEEFRKRFWPLLTARPPPIQQQLGRPSRNAGSLSSATFPSVMMQPESQRGGFLCSDEVEVKTEGPPDDDGPPSGSPRIVMDPSLVMDPRLSGRSQSPRRPSANRRRPPKAGKAGKKPLTKWPSRSARQHGVDGEWDPSWWPLSDKEARYPVEPSDSSPAARADPAETRLPTTTELASSSARVIPDGSLSAAPLLYNHLPLLNNGCDHLRTLFVPRQGSYRDFPGIAENNGCVGHKHSEVCKGSCNSQTLWLPSGAALVLPMYLSFKTRPAKGSNKKRKPSKRFVPFGRVREERVTSTVVGFTNCHALELLHHEQNRILTVRENARMQGFKDYHVFTTAPRSVGDILADRDRVLRKGEKDVHHENKDGNLVTLPSHRYTAAHYLLASDKAAKDADPSLPQRTKDQREANERELLHVLRLVLDEEDLVAALGDTSGQVGLDQLRDRFTAELAKHRKGIQSLYTMVGNAVVFPLAATLGRCIAMAAADAVPPGVNLCDEIVDPVWRLTMREADRRQFS